MADLELMAAGQAAMDTPIKEDGQVQALIILLKEHGSPDGMGFEALASQVASMERRLGDAMEELGAIRQKLQEVQDRSLKAVLQRSCRSLEGNVDALRQRLSELRGQVVEGCRNILADFRNRGATALDGAARFLRIRPALEAVRAAAEKTEQASEQAVSRIDAFSTEFHEAGRHLKNMGRSIQGRPAEAEARENGRIADAFKGAFKIERSLAHAVGGNAGHALDALARLEQRAGQRPSVLDAMKEQAAKAEPAKKKGRPAPEL